MRKDAVSSRVLVPVLASAALGAVVYALTRPNKRRVAPASNAPAADPELRESMVAPSGTAELLGLDLDGVFDANPDDALQHATVHADTRVPPLASADDAEPPAPEDLGAYWLSRATDSERSLDESDLELGLDGLPNPEESANVEQQAVADEEAAADEDERAFPPRNDTRSS